jgi:2-polyprenyl-3-methyl-5-hydroxy-6-metoxy-1,4-benzoquinol methylase
MTYGTRDWLEAQYSATTDDPWGLDRRRSQRFRYSVMLSALAKAMGPSRRPQRIIDIGCATGGFTSSLEALASKEEQVEIIGVDIAQTAVDRARLRFPSLSFERMSMDDCAARFDHSADVVTCLEVLYYLPAKLRADAVKSLCQMLRPGGLILISSMSAKHPYMSLQDIESLLGSYTEIVDSGALYLKPMTLIEKAKMRLHLGRSAGNSDSREMGHLKQELASTARMARWSRRLLGQWAQSHGYVIGRKAGSSASLRDTS